MLAQRHRRWANISPASSQRLVFNRLYIESGAGALGQWIAPLPFTLEFGIWFPVPAVWKKTKMFLPHPRVKLSIVGSLRDREVASSASDRQGSNFKSCVWRTVSSHSPRHPQEVLLAQFSLYVHKGGLKLDSFYLHRKRWREMNSIIAQTMEIDWDIMSGQGSNNMSLPLCTVGSHYFSPSLL